MISNVSAHHMFCIVFIHTVFAVAVAVVCIFHFQRIFQFRSCYLNSVSSTRTQQTLIRSIVCVLQIHTHEHEHSTLHRRFGERALFIICNHQPQIDV